MTTLEPFDSTDIALKWELGFHDRFLGHGDYGIITAKGKLLIPALDKQLAEHIVGVHNGSIEGEECRRAHAELTDEERKAFLRTIP